MGVALFIVKQHHYSKIYLQESGRNVTHNVFKSVCISFNLVSRVANSRAGPSRSLSPCCPACVGGQIWWRPSLVPPARALFSLSSAPPDTGLER